jgi:Flp pilus assembly pilin Flp
MKQRFSPATPVGYLELSLRTRIGRDRGSDDRGASAVEWVVITAILVAIAVAVGAVLREKIQGKADSIDLGTTGP